MCQVDLHRDLKESFKDYTSGMDERAIPSISSVIVASGYDSSVRWPWRGSQEWQRKIETVWAAYPDLMRFGRGDVNMLPLEAKTHVQYQVGATYDFVETENKNKKVLECQLVTTS